MKIIELKNSIGNRFPTNILVLKSILGKNKIPENNAINIDRSDILEFIFLLKKA